VTTRLATIKRNLSLFDTVSIPKGATTEYDGGDFEAIWKTADECNDYIFAEYSRGDGIDVPEGSIVLGIDGGKLAVLVPKEAYNAAQ
jgi:hypothetical protein